MELNPEKFALGKPIEEVCAVSNPSLQKKGIRLEVYYVTLDQQKFKQVLYNLLSNAVKFTEDGGKVELHVAMHDATCFQLSVQDNGCYQERGLSSPIQGVRTNGIRRGAALRRDRARFGVDPKNRGIARRRDRR
jgi:light-regulated signal transduction histidine kinase (bacteriophytochrome)